jgi:hypothetical protein
MIILDAEALGEGGIGEDYAKHIAPALRRRGLTPAEVGEEFGPDDDSYRVISQGRTYLIFAPETDTSGFESWGNATFAIFDIVNRQLEGLPYRFYAFDNGNGLYGMFMTKEIYAEFVGSMKRKIEWPYIPEPEPPWYGQAHD